MRIDVLTIFPGYFAPLTQSLLGRAQESGLVRTAVHDLRDWTTDRHRTVDDTPFGGGPGMVMRPEPWGRALDALLSGGLEPAAEPGGPGNTGPTGSAPAERERPVLVVPSPAGVPFSQPLAAEFAARPWLIFGCGRYEGIDQRVLSDAATRIQVREVSLGDYVLNGGEVAALAMIEAVARLLPGFMGNPGSLSEESHTDGLLESPVFTKPASWRDLEVPEVLRSGHHGAIAGWRREQSLLRTARVRPDLLRRLPAGALDAGDRRILARAGFHLDEPDVAP